MQNPLSQRITKSKIYRWTTRRIKRKLNVENFFNKGESYPHLRMEIEKYPLELPNFNINTNHVGIIGIALDETGKEEFYSKHFSEILEHNGMKVKQLNLSSSHFLEDCKPLDALMFRPSPKPYRLDSIRVQRQIIEASFGFPIYPSQLELALYENKQAQYWHLSRTNFPVIPTFISSSLSECLEYISTEDPPYIFKTNQGASSSGVELISSRGKAENICRKIFSPNGAHSPWQYIRLKGNVIIQKFIENKGFDLRVCVTGNRIYGYYRIASSNDFRASGSGNLKFGPLPHQAIEIAVRLRDYLKFSFIAVDFIQNYKDEFVIVEFSPYIGHTTSGMYRENGIPGWLVFDGSSYISELGRRSWFPHMMAKEFLENAFPKI